MDRRGREVDRQGYQIPQAPIRENGAGSDGRRQRRQPHKSRRGRVRHVLLHGIDTTPEPLEDVLPISPAPVDEENPPGLSNEKEGVGSGGGNRPRRDVDKLAIMDIDNDVADEEVLRPLVLHGGYSLISSVPADLTRALVNQGIMLRLGMGWFKGVIARKPQACTSDPFNFKMFIEINSSTRSVKLPLAKYSVNEAAAEESWALRSRCVDEY